MIPNRQKSSKSTIDPSFWIIWELGKSIRPIAAKEHQEASISAGRLNGFGVS
jgi:hypothetical protein